MSVDNPSTTRDEDAQIQTLLQKDLESGALSQAEYQQRMQLLSQGALILADMGSGQFDTYLSMEDAAALGATPDNAELTIKLYNSDWGENGEISVGNLPEIFEKNRGRGDKQESGGKTGETVNQSPQKGSVEVEVGAAPEARGLIDRAMDGTRRMESETVPPRASAAGTTLPSQKIPVEGTGKISSKAREDKNANRPQPGIPAQLIDHRPKTARGNSLKGGQPQSAPAPQVPQSRQTGAGSDDIPDFSNLKTPTTPMPKTATRKPAKTQAQIEQEAAQKAVQETRQKQQMQQQKDLDEFARARRYRELQTRPTRSKKKDWGKRGAIAMVTGGTGLFAGAPAGFLLLRRITDEPELTAWIWNLSSFFV